MSSTEKTPEPKGGKGVTVIENNPETKEKAATEEIVAPATASPATDTTTAEKPKGTETPSSDAAVAATEEDSKPASSGGADTTPAAPKPAPATSTSDEGRSKRVYVGNLAWNTSWQDLKDHMKSTGLEVARASVMSTPDGRSKGCGIVEFVSADHAQQAIEAFNDTELNGRQIFVREDREERNRPGFSAHSASSSSTSHAGGGAPPRAAAAAPATSSTELVGQGRRVYVGNLSWDVQWQDLKDHMRQAGEVLHAEVMTEHTGRSKGCGIVEFANDHDAQEAIRTLNDSELKGRMIFVREDREGGGAGGGGRGMGAAGAAGRGGHTMTSGNTSVYVWNLSLETSWQDLKDHMRKAGNVDSATILTNPEGVSMGCGVVSYQRPQDAARAIRELQNSELKGQSIHVREDRAPAGRGGGGRFAFGGRGRGGRTGFSGGGGYGGRGSGGDDGTQVHVGNLAPETTWKELKDHFRQCGEVRRAEVMSQHGTVQFYQKKDAEAAVSRLNGSELQGRNLEVRLDQKTR